MADLKPVMLPRTCCPHPDIVFNAPIPCLQNLPHSLHLSFHDVIYKLFHFANTATTATGKPSPLVASLPFRNLCFVRTEKGSLETATGPQPSPPSSAAPILGNRGNSLSYSTKRWTRLARCPPPPLAQTPTPSAAAANSCNNKPFKKQPRQFVPRPIRSILIPPPPQRSSVFIHPHVSRSTPLPALAFRAD